RAEAGRNRQDVQCDPRTDSADRGQGPAQAAASHARAPPAGLFGYGGGDGVAADVTDCAKTPRQPATLEKRPPQFRYGAFSLAARGPRTLFSFFQNAISEFSHSLVRRRISRRIARLYASSRRRLPFLSDRALVNRRG